MSFRNEQVSVEETEKISELARECLGVFGDYVEMGCYKGDTSLLLADIIGNRRLFIYDSFEGLPEKSREDESVLGKNFRKGELVVTKREVKERFLRANLRVPVIKKAWFNELLETDLPERIAFAFLDGDFYKSIRDCLLLIEGKMVPGGVIIVHDYNNPVLPGVKKAVDEWVRDRKIEIFKTMVIIRV